MNEQKSITFQQFKEWLIQFVIEKGGPVPDYDDWKQIKMMLDKVEVYNPVPNNWNDMYTHKDKSLGNFPTGSESYKLFNVALHQVHKETNAKLAEDFKYDPTSLVEDFVFQKRAEGRGSKVEKLPSQQLELPFTPEEINQVLSNIFDIMDG